MARGTGYYLLDNYNPRAKGGDGFHGHRSRSAVITCAVIHVAVIAPTTESAERIGRYFATTDRQASYHQLVDSDGVLPLLPDEATAFHVINFNSQSLGLSFACNTDTWDRYKNWSEQAYQHAAPLVRRWSDTYSLPMRIISRAEAKRGVRGWTFHSIMDPSRRSDPGTGFDAEYLFSLASGAPAAGVTPVDEETDMLKQGDKGKRVEQLQHLVNRIIAQTGGWPRNDEDPSNKSEHLKVDGDYGNATSERVQHAIWRVEKWVLKHPIYANEDGGARVTAQTEGWLTAVSAGLTSGALKQR